MIEVSYIRDYNGIVPEGTFLVESDVDYVKACCILTANVVPSGSTKVWVRQKAHFIWLRNFAEQTNIDCSCIEKTPRLMLAEIWNVAIPEWLDDETVTAERLLDLDITNIKSKRFEDTMLTLFFDKAFYAEKLESGNLPDIISALIGTEVRKSLKSHPVLRKCLEEKIKVWVRNTHEKWVKGICDNLLQDPENLWKELTLWLLLAGYPQKSLEYVVPLQRAISLRTIPLEIIQDLQLNLVAKEQALTQIDIFFKDLESSVKSSSEFRKILECCSGRLEKEFQFIIKLLLSKQFEVSQEEVDLIRQRFKICPGISSATFASLNRFIVPKRPSLPEKNDLWDSDQWLEWAVDEYIPYRHWQTQNLYYDAEIEDVVGSFSDWYMSEYAAIHKDSNKSLIHALGRWRQDIINDSLSLILLIDCLPVTFWHIFNATLTKSGFYRHEIGNRFVPLPSDTEHSKGSLLSGSWGNVGKTYENILKERSENDWGGRRIVYLPNLKYLSEFELPDEPIVMLLNFLPVDEVLHSNVELQGSTYEEELYRLFARISESVKSLFEKWQGQPERFSVYALSDHGACRILNEEKETLDSKTISKLFANEKHRYARVKQSETGQIPDNLWDFGYKFSQPFIKEDSAYFIPRGHNTVSLVSSNKGYVHGGTSPEEVIVPIAVFKPVKAEWTEPALRFLDLKIDQKSGRAVFYIQRVVPLQIEVQNPNRENVRILRVDVLSPDTDVKACTTPDIPGNKNGIVEVDCYFNKSARQENELRLQFTYEIAGEEKIKQLHATVDFKSAVTGGFSLRDL